MQSDVVRYQCVEAKLLELVIYVLMRRSFLGVSLDGRQRTLRFECLFDKADDVLWSQLLSQLVLVSAKKEVKVDFGGKKFCLGQVPLL